jgi:thermitase
MRSPLKPTTTKHLGMGVLVVASMTLLGACSSTGALLPEGEMALLAEMPAALYTVPEAVAGGHAAWAGGHAAWAGGHAAWAGGHAAWAGGDFEVTRAENYDAWKQVHLDTAQQLAPNLGAGVMVAVIDTGIDLEHPIFAGHLVDASLWKDFVDGDSTPQEVGTAGADMGFGHGTGVAATVLQVAPKALILPIRVLKPDGSGNTANVGAAIQYAVSKGAKIINMSLGTNDFDCNIQKTIAVSVPDSVIVVASAGNNATMEETFPAVTSKQSPNSYYAQNKAVKAQLKACGITPSMNSGVNTRTIGVGSVSTVMRDQKSSFSAYGKGLEMLAPGENIFTAVPGGQVGAWSGTSFAAPMVSGALALAMGQKLNPSIDPNKLGEQVAISADRIDTANPKFAGQDYFGFGRLNIENFLKKVLAP